MRVGLRKLKVIFNFLNTKQMYMRYSDSKITDLVKVVGKETSENFSPTLRAKLVGIDEYKGVCTMEVSPSPYVSMKTMGSLNEDKVGTLYEAPIYRIHNAFFF